MGTYFQGIYMGKKNQKNRFKTNKYINKNVPSKKFGTPENF